MKHLGGASNINDMVFGSALQSNQGRVTLTELFGFNSMKQKTSLPARSRSGCSFGFGMVLYGLAVLALPFFIENAYEVYVGTILAGPQMIGFVLAHADPASLFVRIIMSSFVAYGLFGLLSLIPFIRVIVGVGTGLHEKIFAWGFVVLAVHTMLCVTYAHWSPLFSRGS